MSEKKIKVPYNLCKPISEFTPGESITYTGFYEETVNGADYIIDIIKTALENYYIRITDVTDGKYEEVPFDKFAFGNCDPVLF